MPGLEKRFNFCGKIIARVAFGLLLLGAAALAPAQQYVISTYAGGAPLPAPASDWDVSLTADAAGNQYFAGQNSVFKRDQNGVITRVAGNSRPGYSGDGGPAVDAQLNLPWGVAADATGNVFIADLYNHRVRKVSRDGIITTVAGNGNPASSGDGAPATAAGMSPVSVAVDANSNLYIGDSFYGILLTEGWANNLVRKVSRDGIITTIAGGGADRSGATGPATNVVLSGPVMIAADASGNVFIADSLTRSVRKVSMDGTISTVASNKAGPLSGSLLPDACSAGSGSGAATLTNLCLPFGIAVDRAGNVFVAEFGYRGWYDLDDPILSNFAVRRITPEGMITTVSGSTTPGLSDKCDCADVGRGSVAVDDAGNIYYSDSFRTREIATDGTVTTILDNDSSRFSGDGGPATRAQLYGPRAVAADGAGTLFIADTNNNRIRRVSPDGIITTVAGTDTFGYSGDGGPATSAQLNDVTGIAVDGASNLFLVDSRNYRVREVSADGIITTVAGGGMDFAEDGGLATSAPLLGLSAVAVDGAGNVFILDYAYAPYVGNRIRKVSPSGIITTVAGGGQNVPGDGGPATDARLNSAQGLAVDGSGNLFTADNGRIRKVSPDGIITTVPGNGTFGYSGDGAVAVDGAGNLFITDGYRRIRKVSPDGIVTTVAGTDACCSSSGDGGPAANAQLSPVGLAVDGAGNVYAVDASANAVRILRPANQAVLVGAVVDAASQRPDPVSPGKIVTIYGAGLGPYQLIQNQPSGGQFGTELAGTTVSFNGITAPVLYTSATQVSAVVPYEVTGTTAQVRVTYQGQVSSDFAVPVAPSAPSFFTSNQTGAGQAVAINVADGTVNTAANPVKIGDYISLYATGEGQTAPGGVNGELGGSMPTHPLLPLSVTVGGILATVQYSGGVQDQVAGQIQVTVQIPRGLQPGGYVPVVIQVGNATSTPGAVWIAVSGN